MTEYRFANLHACCLFAVILIIDSLGHPAHPCNAFWSPRSAKNILNLMASMVYWPAAVNIPFWGNWKFRNLTLSLALGILARWDVRRWEELCFLRGKTIQLGFWEKTVSLKWKFCYKDNFCFKIFLLPLYSFIDLWGHQNKNNIKIISVSEFCLGKCIAH